MFGLVAALALSQPPVPHVLPPPRPPAWQHPGHAAGTVGRLEVRHGQLVLGVPLGGHLQAQRDLRLLVRDRETSQSLGRWQNRWVRVQGVEHYDHFSGHTYLIVTSAAIERR